MELLVDKSLLMSHIHLIEQRKTLQEKQIELFGQFRAYALNKLKTHGQPFEVKFRTINGDPHLKFKQLNMGDEFFLQYGSFVFDPKNNMITNYIRNEFRNIKTDDDVNKLMAESTGQLHCFMRIQQTMALSTDLEITRINKKMQQKIDKILSGIFKGDLSFDDSKFKALVEMNIALEKELQEIEKQITAANMVTGSAELDGFEEKSVEPQLNRTSVIQFSKEFGGMHPDAMDSSLAVVVLGQQEDVKKM